MKNYKLNQKLKNIKLKKTVLITSNNKQLILLDLLKEKKTEELLNKLKTEEIGNEVKTLLLKQSIILDNFKIQELLKKEISLNKNEKPAKSYLEAIKNRDFNTLKLLIYFDQHDQPTQVNNLINTILRSNHIVFSFLVKNGFNKDFEFFEKKTIVHIAIINSNIKCLNILIKSKCDLKKVDLFGNNPLHYAALIGNLNIVKNLIEAKLDFSLKNFKNQTPLKIAFLNRHQYVMLYLIKNGADIFEISDNFEDFLDFGHDRVCLELFKFFSKKNKDFNLDLIFVKCVKLKYIAMLKYFLRKFQFLNEKYHQFLLDNFKNYENNFID